MEIIKVKNLTGGYKDNTVLHNLSFSIEKGSFTAIAGPNGCGKTTLVKYFIREKQTINNVITICDKDINKYNQKELAEKISFVSQNSLCDLSFTVLQMVQFGRYCHNDIKTNSTSALKALSLAEIDSLKDRTLQTLSGGELKLAMLCRAICQDSEILIFDEPEANLDPAHKLQIMKVLKNLTIQGKTVLCVMHDLNDVLHFSTNCILLKCGQIVTQGSTKDIITEQNIKKVYNTDCRILNQADGQELLTFYCSPSPQLHQN